MFGMRVIAPAFVVLAVVLAVGCGTKEEQQQTAHLQNEVKRLNQSTALAARLSQLQEQIQTIERKVKDVQVPQGKIDGVTVVQRMATINADLLAVWDSLEEARDALVQGIADLRQQLADLKATSTPEHFATLEGAYNTISTQIDGIELGMDNIIEDQNRIIRENGGETTMVLPDICQETLTALAGLKAQLEELAKQIADLGGET